jgi:hypothetical protein
MKNYWYNDTNLFFFTNNYHSMTKITKSLGSLALVLLLGTAVQAQRPEALYVKKALAGQPVKAPARTVTTVTKSSKQALLSCPECYTLSFSSYTPDPDYISVYGADSVWTHTFDATVPAPGLPGGFLNFQAGCFDVMHYADNSFPGMNYWDGFTVSKSAEANPFPCDTACANSCNGLDNQFSSITGGGVLGATDPYTVAYYGFNASYYPYNHCQIKLAEANTICGLYLTNNAYAYKSMKCGDDFARKFAFGDSLVVTISGYLGGGYVNTVNYALADFRNAGGAYIVDAWKFVNLTALGTVDSLVFEVLTSDVGPYGPNTPMYFCMDQVKVGTGEGCPSCPATDTTHHWFPNPGGNLRVASPVSIAPVTEKTGTLQIAPNPARQYVKITAQSGSRLQVFDVSGVLKHDQVMRSNSETITTSSFQPGMYVVKVLQGHTMQTAKFLKQ